MKCKQNIKDLRQDFVKEVKVKMN